MHPVFIITQKGDYCALAPETSTIQGQRTCARVRHCAYGTGTARHDGAQAAGGHDMVSSGSEEEGEDARDATKSAAQNGSNILAKARNIFGQFFLMVLGQKC